MASLEAAVAFVRALSGALPVLVQLLASATVSDVHDSIALLMTYSKFGIAGAQDALRKMLPLVFSFDQGERSILPIQNPSWTPKKIVMYNAKHAWHSCLLVFHLMAACGLFIRSY